MNRCTTFAICCISKTHRKHTQTRQWKKEQSLHKAENNVLQYLTRLGRPVAHRVAKPRSHSSNLLGEQEEDTRFASAARGCQRTTADGFSEGWSEDEGHRVRQDTHRDKSQRQGSRAWRNNWRTRRGHKVKRGQGLWPVSVSFS